MPTLNSKLWRKLFDDPAHIRAVIDRFETDPKSGKRVRMWFGGLEHLDFEETSES